MMTNIISNKKAKVLVGLNLIVLYVIIIVAIIFTLFPFYFMLSSSFKTFEESIGKFTFFPHEFSLQGYKYILSENPYELSFFSALFNTLKIVMPSMLIGLFISTMAAYTFAKRNFSGKNILFWILLITMMIPGAITLMPQYIIYASLNWVDTVLPLMIPGMFGSATCVFFMRQFMTSIPNSLIESAEVDGLNHFKIFIKIILPLSVPPLISQGILWFLAGYNDYISPLIYLQDPNKYTLQIMLAFFSSTTAVGAENVPAILAGAMLTLTPILIMYVFFQKYFISGIAVSGMKV